MIYLIIAAAIILLAYLVINYYPALGGKKSQETIQRIQGSKNFSNGKFINQIPTPMDMNFKESLKLIRKMIKGIPLSKPKGGIIADSLDPKFVRENSADQITW